MVPFVVDCRCGCLLLRHAFITHLLLYGDACALSLNLFSSLIAFCCWCCFCCVVFVVGVVLVVDVVFVVDTFVVVVVGVVCC